MIVSEEFYSICGEGGRAGEASYFVRLSGCNLSCPWCDSRTSEAAEVSVCSVVERAEASGSRWLVVTGGEPTLQPLHGLVTRAHDRGLLVAIETNGTRNVRDSFDWIAVSPKSPRPEQRTGDELKIVLAPSVTDEALEVHFGPGALPDFGRRYIQPLAGDPDSLARAIRLVKERPWWRLSIQLHKLIGVR